ncbi:MAG TPA: hypothetical protein VK629_08205 [Steroidobacteraceae bacterium]|nr:hypothetical protein [Steroidobacteraceae bacterium]
MNGPKLLMPTRLPQAGHGHNNETTADTNVTSAGTIARSTFVNATPTNTTNDNQKAVHTKRYFLALPGSALYEYSILGPPEF